MITLIFLEFHKCLFQTCSLCVICNSYLSSCCSCLFNFCGLVAHLPRGQLEPVHHVELVGREPGLQSLPSHSQGFPDHASPWCPVLSGWPPSDFCLLVGFFFFFPLFNFFSLCSGHVEVPGSRNEPMLQWGPKPMQQHHQILNLLHHKGTPVYGHLNLNGEIKEVLVFFLFTTKKF